MYIFLPHQQGADRQHLVNAGLAKLLRPDDDAPGAADLVEPGPGGLPGQVWAWGRPACYRPATQVWHAARGAPYWYGWERDDGLPHVLARRQQHAGRRVTLGGLSWVLPAVDTVPHRIDLDPQGHLVRLVDEPYFEFATEAASLLAIFADFERNQADPSGWDWPRLAAAVVSALALNYRINMEVATRLNLLVDTDLWNLVLLIGAADQVRAILSDLEKKSGAASPPG